jgi:pilus assembly protein TadC
MMAGAELLGSMAGIAAAAAVAGGWSEPRWIGQLRRPDRVKRASSRASAIWARLRKAPVVRIVGFRPERRRRREADAEIPQLLDLLAAASSAGLAAPLALARSVEALTGPLGDELRIAVGRVELGERWRDQLEVTADSLALPDLRRVVATLARTETLGTPLAAGCAELAAEVRHARRARTTERARTAPVKMLFPLVFLVLPAFLLLTVVPVLLTTVQSIR